MADANNIAGASNWLGTFLVALVPTISWLVRSVVNHHYRQKRAKRRERRELVEEAERQGEPHARAKAHGKGSSSG